MRFVNSKYQNFVTHVNAKSALKYGVVAIMLIICLLIGCSCDFGYFDAETTATSQEGIQESEAISTNAEPIEEITESNAQESEETSVSTELVEETTEVMDEMTALRAFYDDFSANGSLENINDMVKKYGLYTDHRKNGVGQDTYKVAYTKDLAKVISGADLKTAGNYVVIEFDLLKNNAINYITFHTDTNDVSSTEEVTVPKEMNSLLRLFASLTNEMTREEIDAYISENQMVKYAFTHNSAYYIGYDNSAIRQRGRDREGEAVDINFVTQGDASQIGTVKSAEYAVHTGFNTHIALTYKNGTFYYEVIACVNGEEAVQKFLAANQ